jgi:hypothetical protein
MADHVLGLTEASDEPYSDSAISAMVDGDHGSEILEMDLAHVGGRLEEHGKAVLEHVEEAVPLPEVLALSQAGEASSVLKHIDAAVVVVVEQMVQTLVSESEHAWPLRLLPSSLPFCPEHYSERC